MMQSSSSEFMMELSLGLNALKAELRASNSAVAPDGLSRPYYLLASIAPRRKRVLFPLQVKSKMTSGNRLKTTKLIRS